MLIAFYIGRKINVRKYTSLLTRREEKLQLTKEELSHMMKLPGAKTGWLGSEFPEPPTEF